MRFFLIFSLFCASVFAQDKALLDALVTKGVITSQEALNISKTSASVEPTRKTTKSIKLRGRVNVQYENITTYESIGGSSRTLGSNSGFLMRRVFLGARADMGGGWTSAIIVDLCRNKG